MGMNAIAPSEIVAWQDLFGVHLTPWELDMILDLDRIALRAGRAVKKGPARE